MNKAEFGKTFSLSRGQVDRLVAKVVFELPGHGKFTAVKNGDGIRARVDIVSAVKTKKEPAAKPRPTRKTKTEIPAAATPAMSDLNKLDKADLERQLLIAQIEKTRCQNLKTIQAIRTETLSEFLAAAAGSFLGLSRSLADLRLSADQLNYLQEAIKQGLEDMKGEIDKRVVENEA